MQTAWGKFAFSILLTGLLCLSGAGGVSAQSADKPGTTPETGYAVKKPVFGGACTTCPWGVIADVVKKAMEPYGWDIQVCHYCAGGPRQARMTAGAMMATPPENPGPDTPPTPNGPVDFGATGIGFLRSAYFGENDFASDPEGPRKHLRAIARIQTPAYYIVAVKASLGITDLAEIAQKRLPVKMVASTVNQRQFTPAVLEFYGITQDKIESFGGTFTTHYEEDSDVDVMLGFGALVNAPEFDHWYHATQKYDFKYLDLAADLRVQLIKRFHVEERELPLGYFRGVDKPASTLANNGIVIYGRTDMPDDFAYTLARAIDEHQDLLAWTLMNFSYNPRTVWNILGVPLHPGAERYYRERSYMK